MASTRLGMSQSNFENEYLCCRSRVGGFPPWNTQIEVFGEIAHELAAQGLVSGLSDPVEDVKSRTLKLLDLE